MHDVLRGGNVSSSSRNKPVSAQHTRKPNLLWDASPLSPTAFQWDI
jgi:hypothetical protein